MDLSLKAGFFIKSGKSAAAGSEMGMAITAASLPDGYLARNVVLFAVLVYEIIGPALTKHSLMAVGEIAPEEHVYILRHAVKKAH